jgi:predicted GIY-YIG superfamily endonuclease
MMTFAQLEEAMRQAPLISFTRLAAIPRTSGVYTAWLGADDACFYVGLASNLRSRIRSHFSGQRGSDQFCLYVYDSYVHRERCASNDPRTTRAVNADTAVWIRRRVAFRWVELESTNTSAAETHLRRQWRPTLNTLQDSD